MVDKNITYIGVVEDNKDPKRLGRLKIRVTNVFDDIPLEDIPWASPWKDLNGNQFNLPDIGKIVMVIFDDGNENVPEYIYSEHYNINLENKLKSLSDTDYSSMKSVIFDHKTQIYVNDSEGLKIDHKYNNINLKTNSIDINLKDNNSVLNLGDSTSDQQIILGNNFLDWLSKFLEKLMNGGLYNAMGPVIPNPSLLSSFIEFKSLKDLTFLSHHVNVVDNNKVRTVKGENREDISQYGDTWSSTGDDKNNSKIADDDFKPKEGPNEEYDKPVYPELPENALNGLSFSAIPRLDTSGLTNLINPFGITFSSFDLNAIIGPVQENLQNVNDIENSIGVNINPIQQTQKVELNSNIEKMIEFMKRKGYKVYNKTNLLNIIAFRDKDDGVVTNKFDEILFVFFKNEKNSWEIYDYKITTVPGFIRTSIIDQLPGESNILALGQYIDQCVIENLNGDVNNKCLSFLSGIVKLNKRVDRYDYIDGEEFISYDIKIMKSVKSGSTDFVYGYAFNGEQVFKNSNQFDQFMKLCERQAKIKKSFTYTLCSKSEFDKFSI